MPKFTQRDVNTGDVVPVVLRTTAFRIHPRAFCKKGWVLNLALRFLAAKAKKERRLVTGLIVFIENSKPNPWKKCSFL